MNFCKVCGKQIGGEYTFCPFCGATIEKIAQSSDVNADVERIKSVLPLLKNALNGANEEKSELLSKIAEQQKMLDDTVKELTELKEIIKQNALIPMGQNQQQGQNNQGMQPPPYGMYPYPYFYPAYMPQGMMFPGQMPMQPMQEEQVQQNDGVSTNIEQAIVVEPVEEVEETSEQKQTNETSKEEKVETKEPKGKLRARILSFILMLFAMVGIAIPFILPMFGTVNGELNGMYVLDAMIYTMSGTVTSIIPDFNGFAIAFNEVITTTEFGLLHVVYWAFIGGFALTILLLFVNVIFGFVRVATGKTKGRFYFLDYITFATYLISVLGFVFVTGLEYFETGILSTVLWVFNNIMLIGYYGVGVAILARIILSFFVKRTKISKRQAKKQAKKETKLEK